jgi:hypothetical protein
VLFEGVISDDDDDWGDDSCLIMTFKGDLIIDVDDGSVLITVF